MRACFWSLVHGRPHPIDGEDERSAAEGLSFGVLLAMMSADRGGHHHATDLCESALVHLAALPSWRDVDLRHDSTGTKTALTIDTTRSGPRDDTRSSEPDAR